jgi:hypothetical protein
LELHQFILGFTVCQRWNFNAQLVANCFVLLDECWVALTSNTINFSKAYLTFLDDALKMPSADSNIFVDEILHDIFQAQLKHVENSLRSGKYKGEVGLSISRIFY